MAIGVDRDVQSVGAAVRRHRLALGMSAAHLAEAVGVRPSELGRWERGDAVPPPTRIRALARALGVDQATMLTWIADGGSVMEATTHEVAVDIVIDLAPPDPFVTLVHHSSEAPRPVRLAAPATPTIRPRPVASVFPAPSRSPDDDRHVYSATAGLLSGRHPRLYSTGRTVRTAIALAALGVALVWAFDQLGHGVSDLLDLFGGPSPTPGG